MKAIIDGKRYDTGKAVLITERSDGYAGDFRAYQEGLYRTAKGAWFLAGEGGPMTKYARPAYGGDGTTGGQSIIPLNADQAMEWLEAAGETDAIEEYFDVDDA